MISDTKDTASWVRKTQEFFILTSLTMVVYEQVIKRNLAEIPIVKV